MVAAELPELLLSLIWRTGRGWRRAVPLVGILRATVSDRTILWGGEGQIRLSYYSTREVEIHAEFRDLVPYPQPIFF